MNWHTASRAGSFPAAHADKAKPGSSHQEPHSLPSCVGWWQPGWPLGADFQMLCVTRTTWTCTCPQPHRKCFLVKPRPWG